MKQKPPDIILVGPYPPPCGGMAHHTKALLELANDEGIEAVVFDINRNESDDVTPIIGRKDLFKKIIKSDAKVVHIHSDSFDLHYHAPIAALAAKVSKKIIITSLHSGNTSDYYENASDYKKLLIRFCILHSDVLILDNGSLENFTKSLGRNKKTLVISPFIYKEFALENLPKELDEFVKGKNPLFAACGSPSPLYQLDKVIDSFAGFSKDVSSAGLVITETDASDEKGWQGLKNRAKTHGIDGKIKFESGLPHGQFLNLLKRADTFIRFTTHDGDSLSVREAQALGTIVIASDTGARPDGVALVKSFDSQSLANAMSNANRLPKPTPHVHSCSEFSGFYNELLKRSS